MQLSDLPIQGLEATRYAERYVNKIKDRRHEDWSDTSIQYSPHEGIDEFVVPAFVIPVEELTVYQDEPDERLRAAVFEAQTARFFVHPDMYADPVYIQNTGLSRQHNADLTYIFNANFVSKRVTV